MSMKMTMAEFVGLEPCPFCGGEAQLGVNKESTVREYFIGCMNCHIRLYKIGYKRFWSEAEAVEAWNTRHERTCRQILTDCNDGLMPPFVAHCSECGDEWGFTPNFCPNCGARVVE